jgi:hypothetical protein
MLFAIAFLASVGSDTAVLLLAAVAMYRHAIVMLLSLYCHTPAVAMLLPCCCHAAHP